MICCGLPPYFLNACGWECWKYACASLGEALQGLGCSCHALTPELKTEKQFLSSGPAIHIGVLAVKEETTWSKRKERWGTERYVSREVRTRSWVSWLKQKGAGEGWEAEMNVSIAVVKLFSSEIWEEKQQPWVPLCCKKTHCYESQC